MTQFAFVLITSNACNACHNFLGKYWDFFKSETLSQYSDIKIVHMEISVVPGGYTPISKSSFNPEVLTYIKVYPSFIFMKYEDFLNSPIQMKPEYIYGLDENYMHINAPIDITSLGNWVKERHTLLNNKIENVKPTTSTKIKRQRR